MSILGGFRVKIKRVGGLTIISVCVAHDAAFVNCQATLASVLNVKLFCHLRLSYFFTRYFYFDIFCFVFKVTLVV